VRHLERWVDRNRSAKAPLAEIANGTRWPSDPVRSAALVRSTYGHLAPGTPLWVLGQDFEEAAGPVDLAG
jgi:hypothetical protein